MALRQGDVRQRDRCLPRARVDTPRTRNIACKGHFSRQCSRGIRHVDIRASMRHPQRVGLPTRRDSRDLCANNYVAASVGCYVW